MRHVYPIAALALAGVGVSAALSAWVLRVIALKAMDVMAAMVER